MVNDFAGLNRKMEAISRDLSGETSKAQMKRVGAKLAPLIDKAVTADIGDTSMSGWRRSGPIAITGTSRAISDHAVIVEPERKTKGPMAVLERGRNVTFGPGVSSNGSTRRGKKGNVLRARKFKSRRWNGQTEGKETMSDASQLIKDDAPGLIQKEIHKALAKHLRGG